MNGLGKFATLAVATVAMLAGAFVGTATAAGGGYRDVSFSASWSGTESADFFHHEDVVDNGQARICLRADGTERMDFVSRRPTKLILTFRLHGRGGPRLVEADLPDIGRIFERGTTNRDSQFSVPAYTRESGGESDCTLASTPVNGPTAQPTDCGVRHFSKAELEIRYRVQPKHYLIGIGTGKDGNANALVPLYGGLLYNSCAGPFGVLFWLGNFRSPDFPPILKEVPLRRVLNQRVRRIAVSATDTYSKSSPVVGKARCGEDNHPCDYTIDRHYTIHQHWSLVLRRTARTK